MHPYLNIAIKAARSAGKIIMRYADTLDNLKIEEKGPNDFVTVVDKMVEQDIINTIQQAYPHHAILGEETGEHQGQEYTWVVDPIDGTLNFLHGFPTFSVSIAVMHEDNFEHAVVYDPITQDLYTASRGSGTKINDKRCRVTNYPNLAGTLIGTSFPFHNRSQALEDYFQIFKTVFTQCADVRRSGSAALNLSYVASGRLDGFFESGLKPWDIAAGVLLVREAGGFVTDYQGNDDFMKNGTIVAGSRKVHRELIKILKKPQ